MALKLISKKRFDPDKCYPWKGIRRVALRSDRTVYKYHHPDYTNKWKDGTEINWYDYEKQELNCMVEIPKFYYKKLGFNESMTDFDNGHAWYISDSPANDFELHPAFYRCVDKLCDNLNSVAKEIDFRYAPAFLGWVDGQGRLRSLPNKSPQTNITIGQARNYAKANGNGWGIMDFNLYFAIQLLYAIEYGDYDSQTALGRGYVDGNSGKINTGSTLQYGNHSFGETTGKKQMSYRGIEDFWGNCSYWIDGFYCNKNRNILIGNKGFNDTGNGYLNKGLGALSNFIGFIKNIQTNKNCGFVLSEAINSSDNHNTKLYDSGYLFSDSLPMAGSFYYRGSNGGIFSFCCNYHANSSNGIIACSLAF